MVLGLLIMFLISEALISVQYYNTVIPGAGAG